MVQNKNIQILEKKNRFYLFEVKWEENSAMSKQGRKNQQSLNKKTGERNIVLACKYLSDFYEL